MIYLAALFVMTVLCFGLKGKDQLVAIAYIATTCVFALLEPLMGGYEYFPLAGTFDTAFIYIAVYIGGTLAGHLIKLSIATIAINIYGLCAYHYGADPLCYDNLLWGITITAILVLIMGGPHVFGKWKVYSLPPLAGNVDSTGAYGLQDVHGEEGN